MDDGKVNVMSVAMQTGVHSALDRALEDQVAVVIAGRPGMFSAGFDLTVMSSDGRAKYDMVMGGLRLAERVFTFPLPVVMACTGHAVAMGLFLLLAGDYRLGADGSILLAANEVSRGMNVPRSAIEIMRQRITPSALDRVVSLADPVPPDAAVACGVLDQLVAPGVVVESAMARAAELATLDLVAHRTTKMRLRAGAVEALRRALDEDDRELAVRTGVFQARA
jgi:enoyl-CoA hydratase